MDPFEKLKYIKAEIILKENPNLPSRQVAQEVNLGINQVEAVKKKLNHEKANSVIIKEPGKFDIQLKPGKYSGADLTPTIVAAYEQGLTPQVIEKVFSRRKITNSRGNAITNSYISNLYSKWFISQEGQEEVPNYDKEKRMMEANKQIVQIMENRSLSDEQKMKEIKRITTSLKDKKRGSYTNVEVRTHRESGNNYPVIKFFKTYEVDGELVSEDFVFFLDRKRVRLALAHIEQMKKFLDDYADYGDQKDET